MALFQLPSLTNQYRSKADEYLSHLVGHEGKGSLLSALKAKGWASELSAGVGESGYDRNTAAYVFEVHMNLTQAGLEAAPGSDFNYAAHWNEQCAAAVIVHLTQWSAVLVALICASHYGQL